MVYNETTLCNLVEKVLISIVYEFLLLILTLIALPKFLYELIFHKKYRSSIFKRLGFSFPKIEKNGRPLIWIHAVSVGEVKAVASLAKKLKGLPERPLILISSITETGHLEAKRSIPEADYHVFLPFDFYVIMSWILKKSNPERIILCETDFWFNFLRIAKTNGSKIALINGKMSERSMKRFQKFSFFSGTLFSLIDVFCVQGQAYLERFKAIGIQPEKLVVTGNLKFDSRPLALTESQKIAFRGRLGIGEHDKVITIGSTHDTEEKMLLEAIQELWLLEPNLKVILVPRHPERFPLVENLLKDFSVSFKCYSKGSSDSQASSGIILMDAMGLLANCYQISTIAIVAGSYIPSVGGHNILEPLWFGVPLIYGPYMHAQPDLVEAVSSFGAGYQVGLEELGGRLKALLQDEKQINHLKAASAKLISSMSGSTERTFNALTKGWEKSYSNDLK